ncbi:MAG: hypothetical protein HYR85_01280 [Planctomycetes bacterium]|nr:hypothetical protein [Planctomycetota bacterium]MBI3843151.1 hypothetical protein [Planctomycetota bacterium]
MGNGAAAGAAAAAAIARATKASGVIVRLEPPDCLGIVGRQAGALVVCATGGFIKTSYKGLAFYTKSPGPLPLPSGVEVVTAQTIWIP